MQPANPQPQPAADESASAVTAGIAGLRSVLSSARIYFDRPILKQADSELEALLREREALAAMTTRALAAEAALNNLQDKGYEFVKSLDNYKAVAYWQDQARITGRDAWLDTLNLFTEFTDLCYTTEVEARIHLAASADEPTGGEK